MITIDTLIEERLSEKRLASALAADDMKERVYRAHPKLRDIDSKLIGIRTDRMLAAIDHLDKSTSAVAAMKLEADLRNARVSYIKDNNIDPDFDKPKEQCSACGDTGYINAPSGIRVVCSSCMTDVLEEGFVQAGLKSYTSYTLKSFDANKFGDRKKRTAMFKNIKKLFEEDNVTPPLWVLSDLPQTGKTFMSVIAVKYAIVEGKSACYIKADELLEISDEQKDALIECRFLVIDDYSGEVTLKWTIAANLNRILEERGAAGRSTLLVASLPVADLEKNGDQRISSKISKAGRI